VADPTGFGKVKAKKQPSKSAAQRKEAAKQFDQMKADGLPEFNIFIRIKDQKAWFPAGSLAVNRSNLINHAIYEKEADLLQGAFRLFPILKKNQQNLEYGYRLKQFPDEEIQLASRPQAPGANLLQTVKDRVGGLFANITKK
jgi:Family of unknown function (DUF6523)